MTKPSPTIIEIPNEQLDNHLSVLKYILATYSMPGEGVLTENAFLFFDKKFHFLQFESMFFDAFLAGLFNLDEPNTKQLDVPQTREVVSCYNHGRKIRSFLKHKVSKKTIKEYWEEND